MEGNATNQKAMELLHEAAFTSSLIKAKERESGIVPEENMFPANKKETDRMAELLGQAKAAADDDQDPAFVEKFDQLNDIVQWSYARHRTWKFSLICGVILLALLFLWARSSSQDSVQTAKDTIAKIEAWTESDTTISWEKSGTHFNYSELFTSANKWKANKLASYKTNYLECEKNLKTLNKSLKTATTDSSKNAIQKQIEYNTKDMNQSRAIFDSIAAMNFQQIKASVIADENRYIKSSESSATTYLVFIILLAVLIGLYIWTGYPYGYEMTRSRTRNKILEWVRKFGFSLASTFFGAGLAAKLFADDYIVKTTFMDGHTETRRESDIAGTFFNIIIKFGLMAVGAFIFIFISIFIIFIETAGGLKNKIR